MTPSAWFQFGPKGQAVQAFTVASRRSISIPLPAGPVPGHRGRPAGRSLRAALDGHWAGRFLIALIWYGATAWLRPLAIPDEGRYVGVAREMLLSGDWLVPTLNGAPFFHKPPLFYWLTAASMQVFGTGVMAARLASVLAAAVVTAGLVGYLRRWTDASRARWAGMVLATTPLFFGGAQYANLDMLVAACIGATVLLAAHAAASRDAGQPYRMALASAFVAAGVGVLAKGLIGAVLPALVLVTWGLVTRRLVRTLTLLVWAPGGLLFCAVAAPWFIAMQARFSGFDHYFFVVQHFERFASTGFNNAQPFWFYPGVLVLLTIPWSPWLLALGSRSYWRQPDPFHVRALMAVWLGVVAGFFSMPNSKLIGYILPALPPLAFFVADACHHAARAWQGGAHCVPRRLSAVRLRRIGVGVAAVACVAIAITAHFRQPKSMQVLAQRMQAERQPDEAVMFLEGYYYDVAFYAHLTAPVRVVDRWLPSEVAKDSWRRELVDSTRFAPASLRANLLPADALKPVPCGAPGVWVIGPADAASRHGALSDLAPVYATDHTALWHLAPGCPASR